MRMRAGEEEDEEEADEDDDEEEEEEEEEEESSDLVSALMMELDWNEQSEMRPQQWSIKEGGKKRKRATASKATKWKDKRRDTSHDNSAAQHATISNASTHE